MKKLLFLILSLFLFTFFTTCITTFAIYSNKKLSSSTPIFYYSNAEYSWPIPECTTISSYFGYRISPITGLPSTHLGIDIPAPERNKDLFFYFWNCNISWISWCKWLYCYNQKFKYRIFLFSYFSRIYC